MSIILASKSPRRRELLSLTGVTEFEIIPSSGEPVLTGLSPEETVSALARFKAESVRREHPDDVVIGVDTLVFLDGRALGKPKDEADAREMLRALSGRRHFVLSGVAVLTPTEERVFAEKTDVYFRSLTERELSDYAASGDPLDKAGAYGIQGRAAAFVERIDGDYYNVMGLPVCRLTLVLRQLGMDI